MFIILTRKDKLKIREEEIKRRCEELSEREGILAKKETEVESLKQQLQMELLELRHQTGGYIARNFKADTPKDKRNASNLNTNFDVTMMASPMVNQGDKSMYVHSSPMLISPMVDSKRRDYVM